MTTNPFFNKTLNGLNISGSGGTDLTNPGPIGGSTPSTGNFTNLTSNLSQSNNVILNGSKTTVTANNTIITLTYTSNGNQILLETGLGNYSGCVINLPATSTLVVGEVFYFNNNCATTSWTIQTATAVSVVTSAPGSYIRIIVLSTANDLATAWDFHASAPQGSTWSTSALATSSIINASNGFNGSIGAFTPNTGKFTTGQLTTNMATAGVLLNDTSGNITSSLGALALGKGGTGVTAGYGTGTTVALPPTGGLAGNALVSGAGAGAALTWSAGQGAVYCYRQATGTTCPNTTLTGITWDTLITTTGQPLATNFTYATNSGGTGGTFTYVGTNTVAIYISFTVNMASTNCTLTANINPSTGSQITSAGAGAGTYNYTTNVSGVIVLATNGTFNCQANQTSGGSRVTTIGIGANSTCLSIVVLPI